MFGRIQKGVRLEKMTKPEELAKGWLLRFWADWKLHKRYDSEAQAIQAHDGMMKSSFNHHFDWRIVSPLGTITLK